MAQSINLTSAIQRIWTQADVSGRGTVPVERTGTA